jgi:AbrB family looped-hinge helix DNA binding protein
LEVPVETTLLSSKGQVIIPKPIRESHHFQPGMRFVVEDTPAGILLRPMTDFAPTDLVDGLGCSGYQGPARSVEEMDRGIDAELRQQWRKGTGK